jgi:molybdenum cofactor cytidylyltransferase
MNTGVIILAAGSSSRMGQSKQLLPIQGTTLLVRAVHIALQLQPGHTVVVLGSNEAEHTSILQNTNVHTVTNHTWQNGMGSSLKTGLQYLLSLSPAIDAVLILVCDQPAVTTTYLESLVQHYKPSNKSIVASFYSDAPGVPALFDKSLFTELLNMDDAHGAKKIIQKHIAATELIPFPEGSIDLDTPEDYQRFINSNK